MTLVNKFYPFDKIIIIYALLMILIIITFGQPLTDYTDELLLYLLAAAASFLIAMFVDESKGRWAMLVRLIYSGVLFALFYRITGGTMFLLFESFLDYQIVGLEQAIYGVNLTLYIDEHLLTPVVTEILSFSYFCYYPMVPVFMLTLFFKKDYDILKHFLAAAALTYFVSYMLFFLYPIEGPRWHFAGQYLNQIDGYFFRYLVEVAIDNGAVRGGCMPSSHTGIAILITMYCFKHYPLWGRILLPIVIGLSLGTIWGRFHYVSDVYVGAAIAIAAYYLVQKKYPAWTADEYKLLNEQKLKADYVS